MNAQQIIDLVNKLGANRSNFEAQWQECADYGMPTSNQITVKSAAGHTKMDLFDTTAEECIIKASAGLYSYMFPADNKAFILKVDDEALNDADAVKQWLAKVTDIIHDYFIKSNFRKAFFQFLKSLLCFGTAVLYIDKGKKTPINYICRHVKGLYFTEDPEGNVDQVFYKFEFTAHQAIMEFGRENLDERILTAENERPTDTFEFIHAIYPRDPKEVDEESIDKLKMRYAEKYIDVMNKKEVEEGGHPEMPYIIDRFDKGELEQYGRSPMMKKLPDVKMINKMKKTRIKAWEKMTDPPVIVPNDGSIWPLATQPGGVIFKRPDADDPTYFEFKGNLQGMEEAILDVRNEIRMGFFVDIFEPLVDHKNMTAFEVDERKQEKLRSTIPVVGMRQSETFNPLIHRTIGVLMRANKIPPVPQELADAEYSIQFLGQIALSLKTLEVLGWMKVMEQITPLAEMGLTDLVQNVLDNYELDLIYRDSARNNGMSGTWLKDKKKVMQERGERAQAQQQQMLMQAAPDLTKAMANAGKAPEPGSPAEMLMNG
jgi:hypothetical protein